jgi:hypothetical protein
MMSTTQLLGWLSGRGWRIQPGRAGAHAEVSNRDGS